MTERNAGGPDDPEAEDPELDEEEEESEDALEAQDYEDELARESAAGEVCSNCGAEFIKAHGRPVMCKDCWAAASDTEREGFEEAIHPQKD